jgi:hypothetical protein
MADCIGTRHPFLARTNEIVINNIGNRFTAADYDDMQQSTTF